MNVTCLAYEAIQKCRLKKETLESYFSRVLNEQAAFCKTNQIMPPFTAAQPNKDLLLADEAILFLRIQNFALFPSWEKTEETILL